MEKAAAFDVDLEGWELLPDQGMLSIYGKGDPRRSALPKEVAAVSPKGADQADYFPDQSHLLVESMDDLGKGKPQGSLETGVGWAAEAVVDKLYPDEKIVTEVPPPLPPPVAEESPVAAPASPRKFQEYCEGENSEEEEEGADEGEGKEKNPALDDGGVAELKCLSSCDDQKGKGWLDGFGFGVWKWRLTGIGALCSIGVAAATICILILGGRQRHKQHQAEKLQFQIYADDKNLKQIVQHASRLNQAISGARGAPPATRANISFGGYYDGI